MHIFDVINQVRQFLNVPILALHATTFILVTLHTILFWFHSLHLIYWKLCGKIKKIVI